MSKAARYTQLTPEEKREFLAHTGTRHVRIHALTKRICHWPYCAYCGLVALKNEPTRKELRRPCVSYE